MIHEPKSKFEIIHKEGQPYGIRDKGGFLLFFSKVQKWQGQEQRYIDELQEIFNLANKIVNALNQ